jgi:glycosyltransferase involved in cell wall biosynthesis
MFTKNTSLIDIVVPNNSELVPTISICIPTYNRGDKVFGLVKELLKYPNSDLEVVVLDNCSTDRTEELLARILDPRLSFVRNNNNIGGPLNLLKALTLAKGEFAFICLDKDRLDFQRIGILIDKLRAHKEVAFGHCTLNVNAEGNDLIYGKGFEALMNMSYLSSHPTGMFYKTTLLKTNNKLLEIFKENKKFAFYTDILNAEMAMLGAGLKIDTNAFFTETKDESAKVQSYTYDVKDLYFAPDQRITELRRYIDSVISLNLSKLEEFKLIRILYIRGFIAATIGFKGILSDHEVCAHYNISPQNLSFIEVGKNCYRYSSKFVSAKLPLTMFRKVYIAILGFVGLFIKLLKP